MKNLRGNAGPAPAGVSAQTQVERVFKVLQLTVWSPRLGMEPKGMGAPLCVAAAWFSPLPNSHIVAGVGSRGGA